MTSRRIFELLIIKSSFSFNFKLQANRQESKFQQPAIDYSPWSPVDVVEYPLEPKYNKARSIAASEQGAAIVSRRSGSNYRGKNKIAQTDDTNELSRSIPTADNNIKKKQDVSRNSKRIANHKIHSTSTAVRTAIKRRINPLSSTEKNSITVTASSATTIKTANQRQNRRINSNLTTQSSNRSNNSTSVPVKSRREYTSRVVSEQNYLMTTTNPPSSTKASLKRVPFTRGNFKPAIKDKVKENADDENYPEHFKLLLKTKEVDNDVENPLKPKSAAIKAFRQGQTSKTSESSVRHASKTGAHFPTRARSFSKFTASTTEASTEKTISVSPKVNNLRRPKPTERSKISLGNTIQQPPTAKSTRFTTRIPAPRFNEEFSDSTFQEKKNQINPAIKESFVSTSAVSLKLIESQN